MPFKYTPRSIKSRLMLLMAVILFVTNLSIGLSSYLVARSELEKSAELTLKNGIKMYKDAISLANEDVKRGSISIYEAQESMRIYILGKKDKDGKRPINKDFYLGEQGYFYVIDKNAKIVAHPTYEGQYTMKFNDMKTNKPFFPQIIDAALKHNGGFTSYHWVYPGTNKIGKKIAYSELDPTWGWILVASVYVNDFDKGSVRILEIFYSSLIVTILLGLFLVYKMSHSITDPIVEMHNWMIDFGKGKRPEILIKNNNPEEVKTLAKNFKYMIKKLDFEMEAKNRYQMDLEKMNCELESLVDLKTSRLQESLDQLQKTQAQLIASEKMAALGNLVAGISHEVNTPLGVGVTAVSHLDFETQRFLKELSSGNVSADSLKSYLSKVEDSVEILATNLERASDLIRSFKEIAVNQTSENLVKFDLTDYINKIILSLKHEYKRTNHKIIFTKKDSLFIKSYPGAFSQILTNLIMNSLIHGFENIKDGLIEINISIINKVLCLSYSDNGKGISLEDTQKIFEPFYTTKKQQGGSGLGLSIVYNLVTQRLHGTIEVIPRMNRGIEFSIKIPLDMEVEDYER